MSSGAFESAVSFDRAGAMLTFSQAPRHPGIAKQYPGPIPAKNAILNPLGFRTLRHGFRILLRNSGMTIPMGMRG
jgi:hypothetical protein